MNISSLRLKNFRCFPSLHLVFSKKLVVIEGPNGIGKTSLLEAIHYLCYGRSFRTRMINDLIADNTEAFNITAEGNDIADQGWHLHVGGTATKRVLKINNQHASSYKELIDLYRVISVTEDDVMMIKGAPELRRMFIDQALTLHHHELTALFKSYRKILDQRNSALWHGHSPDALHVWTTKLEEQSQKIRSHRQELLYRIEKEAVTILRECMDTSHIAITYQARELSPRIAHAETRLKRSLFGAHLDDLSIEFRHASSRTHASRGQQKLIALIIKIAHLRLLQRPTILLLDDFLTDFDGNKIKSILHLIDSLPCQVILTSPLTHSLLNEHLASYNYQLIKLQEA